MANKIIHAEKLTGERYAPYGQVIAGGAERPFKPANFGRAKRYDYLAEMQNLRPESAKLNVCIFACSAWSEAQLEIKILERHAHSTQVFMPMAQGRYITIVAGDKDAEPDLESLRAFVVDTGEGISYRPGIWHYPMTVLGQPLNLSCLVYEDGTAGDCEVVTLPHSISIYIPV